MKNITPIARFENIVVQELPDETLICDLISNRVFCLNKTASEVWKLCDGKNDVSQLNEKLSKKFREKITDDLIWITIDKLSNLELLAETPEKVSDLNYESRREMIKKIGLTSMVALPLVSLIIAPTALSAQSGQTCLANTPNPAGCPCASAIDCSSGCCLENFPNPPICGNTFGQQGCICSSDLQCDTNNFECCAPSNPVCNPGC